MWRRRWLAELAALSALAAAVSAASAQEVGTPATFEGGAKISFSVEAARAHPRIIFDSGQSNDFMEPWDSVLFNGVSPDAGVVFELSRRDASGRWSAWSAAAVRRFPGGRFWGRAKFALAPGPLRLRAVDKSASAANAVSVFSVEVFDSTEDAGKEEAGGHFSVGGGTRPLSHGRQEWKAKPPKSPYISDAPYLVTIHHTAGLRTKTLEESLAEVRFIQDFHQNGRGWSDIAYHFLIDAQGNIFEGRPEAVVGSHVRLHNEGNVGIALLGDYHPPKNDQPTPEQAAAVVALGRYLVARYDVKVGTETVRGHRDYNSATSCPGDIVYALLGELRSRFGEPAPAPAPAIAARLDARLRRELESPNWDGRP